MKAKSYAMLACSLFALTACGVKDEFKSKKDLKIDSHKSSQTYEESSSDQFTKHDKDDKININEVVETVKKLNDYSVASTKYYDSVSKELENMNIIIDSPQIKNQFSQFGYDNGSVSVVHSSIAMNEEVEESTNGTITIKFLTREASSPIGETSISQIGKNVQQKLTEDKYSNLNHEVTYTLTIDDDQNSGKLTLN